MFPISIFVFSICMLKISLNSSTFPLSSLSILIARGLNSTSCRLLVSTLFNLFLEFCFAEQIETFWTCFFTFSFCLHPCVCFYILGRAATSLSFGRVASWSRCPMGPVASLHGHLSWLLQVYSGVCPPVVVESWFLLVHPCEILTLRLIGCEEWWQWNSCCAGADHTMQDSL